MRDSMAEDALQIPPELAFMSFPCVALGGLLLLYWWTAIPPSVVPEGWRYASLYTSLYEMMPVLGGGTLGVGLLSSVVVGWTVFTDGGDHAGQ